MKYSFEYMLDPKNKASRRPIFDRLSHVEIDSPHRLRVILKEPYSPWVYFLTKHMGIWPKGSREALGDDYFRLNPKGVGTGPGIFEEWKPNDYVSLVRNPNYWQKGKPGWDRLVVKFVPEDASRVAYLLSGQIDLMGAPPPRDFADLKKRSGVDGDTRGTFGGWSVLLLNSKRPPFDDVNFRRALSHAVDRETITKRIFYGLVEKSAIPAPASSWWFNPEADKSLAYDLDKAKHYLKKSKYAEGASFELMSSSVPYLLDFEGLRRLPAIGVRQARDRREAAHGGRRGDFARNVPRQLRRHVPQHHVAGRGHLLPQPELPAEPVHVGRRRLHQAPRSPSFSRSSSPRTTRRS